MNMKKQWTKFGIAFFFYVLFHYMDVAAHYHGVDLDASWRSLHLRLLCVEESAVAVVERG